MSPVLGIGRVYCSEYGSPIGMTRFELAAPWSQTKCATKLRHIPILFDFIPKVVKLLLEQVLRFYNGA